MISTTEQLGDILFFSTGYKFARNTIKRQKAKQPAQRIPPFFISPLET